MNVIMSNPFFLLNQSPNFTEWYNIPLFGDIHLQRQFDPKELIINYRLLSVQGPYIRRKAIPGRRVTRLPELPQASQLFLHFFTWQTIYTSKKNWLGQKGDFPSGVTLFPILTLCLAQPGQLVQDETIRACASVAGSGKGNNFFLIIMLAEVDSAGRVTRSCPGRIVYIQTGPLATCKRTQQLPTFATFARS